MDTTKIEVGDSVRVSSIREVRLDDRWYEVETVTSRYIIARNASSGVQLKFLRSNGQCMTRNASSYRISAVEHTIVL